MKKIFFFVIILFSAMLTACAAQPTGTPTASNTPAPVNATATHLPTNIPPAAATLPPEIPATPTVDIFALEKFNTCQISPHSLSPARIWDFATCGINHKDGLITQFSNGRRSKFWLISFNDIYIQPYRANDANIKQLLRESFVPVYWTPREDYVYLAVPTTKTSGPYMGYDALFRLDLMSGKVTPTLNPATAPLNVSYAFKFSSGTKIAYINQTVQTVKIVIDDIITGDEKIIRLDGRFTQAGSLLWPQDDEKRLIFSAFDANTTGGGYALIVYDLETNKNEYIMQQTENAYLPIDWLDEDTIYAQEYPTDKLFYINLTTKTITEVGPSLKPAP